MENHNVTLQPIKSVRLWDLNKIEIYKEKINEQIQIIKSKKELTQQELIVGERYENYYKELEKIFEIRKQIGNINV